MRVYGGWIFGRVPGLPQHSRQIRAIIAASSRQQVVDAFHALGDRNMTVSFLSNYWCETGNEVEVALAMSSPGTIFVSGLGLSNQWYRYNGVLSATGRILVR
jgi:hypothetical protein